MTALSGAISDGFSTMVQPAAKAGTTLQAIWPMNQIACKVVPALAAGCTMVLKPSEIAPLNAVIYAEILDAAGVPKGVFNLVNGDGASVGQAIAAHPDIDMVSFTGSTRAGIAVAKAAADTVKRVHQELGGKSANIILPDADLQKAVAGGVQSCFTNSGQSCNAEGATLVAGGPGRPEGFNRGYYVRPTVFANVKPEMTISREEIFGPVLSILPYDSEEQAVRMANDTVYGLSGYVQSGDLEHARKVAAQLRT